MKSGQTFRDPLKEQSYFDKQVVYNEASIEKFHALIAQPGESPSRLRMLRHTLYRRELEQLIARYSRGEPVGALQADYPRVIEALAQCRQDGGAAAQDFANFDAYVFALWIMSLAILLDVGAAETHRAAEELGNPGRDNIYDSLLGLCSLDVKRSDALMYPSPYLTLRQALDADGPRRQQLLAEFLDAWYPGMKPAYWQGSDTGTDSGYFGYWCFELAAFVKALGIDDSAFADHAHYPRDLARRDGVASL